LGPERELTAEERRIAFTIKGLCKLRVKKCAPETFSLQTKKFW
jgi:hypothetical protein